LRELSSMPPLKRGTASKQIELLSRLRPLLRAGADPERMLRSVTRLLAVEVGQYCLCDAIDREGNLRRLAIEHADPSRRTRLRVACDDTVFEANARTPRLLAKGGAELMGRVSDHTRVRGLSDIVLLPEERVRSYMAAVVDVTGSPMAVFTMVVTRTTRRYSAPELALLKDVTDWVGLGLENALRRELEPRASVVPSEAPPSMKVARGART
jgi:hypothetical protein